MAKIYTKTGDTGKTGLVSGNRVLKSDSRINLYGEVDELNSRIGYSASLLGEEQSETLNFLEKIQSAIFDLGSNLACEAEFRNQYNLPHINQGLIAEIEANIDEMENNLSPLKNFILPGGSTVSASLHLCRTSARKCERMLVEYSNSNQEEIPENSLIFLNRLSDYFFVCSRFMNNIKNVTEIIWKKHS